MAEIRVPALGESVTEATIGKWFKQPGDPVAVDEPLVELETDKVTIEVPAPAGRPGPKDRDHNSRYYGSAARANGDEAGGAAGALGAQDRRRNRHRRLDRPRLREGWSRDQGRHDGGDRTRRFRADARGPGGGCGAGARAVAGGRRRARRAREDDP